VLNSKKGHNRPQYPHSYGDDDEDDVDDYDDEEVSKSHHKWH